MVFIEQHGAEKKGILGQMAGRRPKPTAEKIASGNPGKRPINDAEPEYERNDCSVPFTLTGDDFAVKKWVEVAELLAKAGVLTVIDNSELEAYCLAYSRFTRCTQLCLKMGDTYETEGKNGSMWRIRPERTLADKAANEMRMMAVELGLTPSSRSRMRVQPIDPRQKELPLGQENEEESYFNRRTN